MSLTFKMKYVELRNFGCTPKQFIIVFKYIQLNCGLSGCLILTS